MSRGLSRLSRKAFLRKWHSSSNLNVKKEQIVPRSAGRNPWSGIARAPLRWEHENKGKGHGSRGRPGSNPIWAFNLNVIWDKYFEVFLVKKKKKNKDFVRYSWEK